MPLTRLGQQAYPRRWRHRGPGPARRPAAAPQPLPKAFYPNAFSTPSLCTMFALSDGVADPRGLAGYFNTTRRSLFGSQAEVQRLDVDLRVTSRQRGLTRSARQLHKLVCARMRRRRDLDGRPDETSVLAQGRRRTIPDVVIDAHLPPSRELCPLACVGSKAKPGSHDEGGRPTAWSAEQHVYEVIFSRNDSTYDVGR